MTIWTEMAAIWLADAIEGDCDMEPQDMEPEPEGDGTRPPVWGDDDDMEAEGVAPGFLHRNGAWVGGAV